LNRSEIWTKCMRLRYGCRGIIRESGIGVFCCLSVESFLGLRVSDLIRLRVGNIRGKKSFEVVEKKTGKKNTITINRHLRETIEVRCADLDDEDYILQSTRHKQTGGLSILPGRRHTPM